MHSTDPKVRGEWIWRIAKLFTLPILSLFALGLVHVDSRTGKSSGMIMSFIVYLSYSNVLGYAVAMIKKGDVSSSFPVWGVHIAFALLAVYCLYRRNYNLPLVP